MVEQRVMYRTVLLHIPHHMLERARGILTLADTADHPFTELRDRLVERLTLSILDKCTGILWGAKLGSRRPTELLEVMMAALPPDEPPGHIFKTIFLHRLPGDLKDLVAVQFHQLGVVELTTVDTRTSSGMLGTPRRRWWRRAASHSGGGDHPRRGDGCRQSCSCSHHPCEEEVAWQQEQGWRTFQRRPGGRQRRRPELESSLRQA